MQDINCFKPLISRIAPTPSGYLHIGNGINFTLTYLLTKKYNGHLHLRIDDYDSPRIKTKYIENIFASLEFLGITYDSGARSVSEYEKDYKFSKEKYLYALEKIKNHTFTCKCSRKKICTTCKDQNLSYAPKMHTIRIKLDENQDVILWRKEDLPSYNFACIIDDEKLKTSLIVRGEDLRFCTDIQLQMAKKFGFKYFLNTHFIHHKLFHDKMGKKLSKSQNAPSLMDKNSKKIIFLEVAKILSLPEQNYENLAQLEEIFLA